jgi:hypothetical protein
MKVSLKNIIVPSIPLAVLLVLGCIGLWFSAYFGERFSATQQQGALLAHHIETLIHPNSLLSNIISIAFTLLNAFLLSQINNRFTIIRTRTFLPVFVFLLLMSSWNETHIANSSHIILTLIIFSLYFFFSMARDKNSSEQAFMGSLLLSISCLFINPLILLIPVCWIGFIIFQSFSLRTFIASILGVLAPWIIFVSVKYLFMQSVDLSNLVSIKPNLEFDIHSISLPLVVYSIAFLSFATISIIGVFTLSNGDAIHTRNKLNFLILYLVSLVIIGLLFRNQLTLILPMIALVFSILFSHPFTLKQNNFYGILFSIFCFINIAYIISKYILI